MMFKRPIFDSKKIIILLLGLGNIAISFGTGAISAAIPSISLDLNRPEFVVANIVPFYMIPYGLGALLYAPLTKVVSYRRCLILAMATFSLASFISSVSGSFNQLLIAQIFAGIAAASSTPLSLMIIGDFFDKSIRGRLVGLYFGCSFFSSTLGMIFMGIAPWRWLFFIPFVLGAVTVCCLWFLKIDQLNSNHRASVNYFKAFQKEDIRNVFIFIFIMSCLYHSVIKWYGVYLNHEYGLGNSAVSVILILASLCGLVGQQVGGYLSDKKGRRVASYAGMLVLSLGTIGLVGHYPVIILTLILGIISMGWTISHNSVSTGLTDFPDDDRPVIASLNSSVRFVSGGLGFSLSRVFVEKSFSLTFLGIGIIFFLMIFTVRFAFSKQF